MTADAAAAAAERKRKRLEAWRKRQQEKEEGGDGSSNGTTDAPAPAPAPRGFQTTSLPLAEGPSSSSTSTVKIGLGMGLALGQKRQKKKKKKKAPPRAAAFEGGGKDGGPADGDGDGVRGLSSLLPLLGAEDLGRTTSGIAAEVELAAKETDSISGGGKEGATPPAAKRRRRGRWDVKGSGGEGSPAATANEAVSKTAAAVETPDAIMAEEGSKTENEVSDALDTFMMRLEAGDAADNGGEGDERDASSDAVNSLNAGETAGEGKSSAPPLRIDARGSMVRIARSSLRISDPNNNGDTDGESESRQPLYAPSDWESDAPPTPRTPAEDSETDGEDEEEEKARRAFIEALKNSALPPPTDEAAAAATDDDKKNGSKKEDEDDEYETRSEVQSEQQRRDLRVRALEEEASRIRRSALRGTVADTGRFYADDEGNVMDEAERTLAALNAAPDALEVLAEMNKKKELRAVDHDEVEYLDVRKNLYIVPRTLANLSPAEVMERRSKLGVKVRGRGAPVPVSTFREAGLSERILTVLEKKGISEPFPVQAQCLPCIMAGRDVIGIAKTGSGKTLAFVLPMLRHILEQPPLLPNETGPIGLVMAPARELAYQIHSVCKSLCKPLGLKSTAAYGGAGVAEQIGDLKRGTHILCATPGRLIDILTMQSGKVLSLQRVSMVCLDECDRAFDMGFEPQISAILSGIRPDRQTVLFSATFPRAVENLARKSLRTPLEVIVGGRSVASDSVVQYAEVCEEQDKFLRLLQILGEHAEATEGGGVGNESVKANKAIIFVGRQEQADSLFEQLIRCGYPGSLSIHGGMDQEDRDSNMSDFKRPDGPAVLVATSVAGRGLDVPSCGCVVNYSSPNHLEEYVHRVGRTGRAGNKGVSYTLVNTTEESKYAPVVVRAMIEAGQSANISQELKDLSEAFKDQVARGEARWASSGYKGRGYTYDSSEMSDVQKLARMEKREALIEAGLVDPDEEDPTLSAGKGGKNDADGSGTGEAGSTARSPGVKAKEKKEAAGMLANVTSGVLAIPGMREALLKKAGMFPPEDGDDAKGNGLSTGTNHFVEELEINDYPREARWKVTQKETTSRLQDEFQTAVTLKGQFVESGKSPAEGERKLYLHLEAQSKQILQNCIVEIKRLLNEETLRVGARSLGGGHRYNVLS